MKCGKCGAEAKPGFTTSVTDLGGCLLIVRNVPCYKCTECNDIFLYGRCCTKTGYSDAAEPPFRCGVSHLSGTD